MEGDLGGDSQIAQRGKGDFTNFYKSIPSFPWKGKEYILPFNKPTEVAKGSRAELVRHTKYSPFNKGGWRGI